jgi:hypothetical protein
MGLVGYLKRRLSMFSTGSECRNFGSNMIVTGFKKEPLFFLRLWSVAKSYQ